MSIHDFRYFFEDIPVNECFQLFECKVDSVTVEKIRMLLNGLVK